MRSLYIGYTSDLKRRLKEHLKKYNFELIYCETYANQDQAILREKNLKQYGSAWQGLKKRLDIS